MHTQQLAQTHPHQQHVDRDVLVAGIEALYDCAQSCTACGDACLGEDQMPMLRRCIRLCLDCADVCMATGQILSRQTEPAWDLVPRQLQACVTACQVCGEECKQHAGHHEHCRVCADACQRCEEVCNQVLNALPA
jgi:hypothetical protein